jgi:hypothetical protein
MTKHCDATNQLPEGQCDQCGKPGPILSGCDCGGFVPAFLSYDAEDDDGDTGEDTNVEDSHAR